MSLSKSSQLKDDKAVCRAQPLAPMGMHYLRAQLYPRLLWIRPGVSQSTWVLEGRRSLLTLPGV